MNAGEAGLIIIGDEILSGKHQDSHMRYVIDSLKKISWQLSWVQFLSDDHDALVQRFELSLQGNCPVFCFGGIGATPDDCTRQACAQAAGVELVRHPEAVAAIEAQFGQAAYPKRILMSELPAGSRIIPNPVNQVPGFSFGHHHFFPGFPSMAWPMLAWVLAHEYGAELAPVIEYSVKIINTPESELIEIMQAVNLHFPTVKVFSLPHLGGQRYVELGVRSRDIANEAFAELCQRLDAAAIAWETQV